MPNGVHAPDPVIPPANMTVGAVKAAYAWSQLAATAAKDGGAEALLLAQTLEKRGILAAANTPNFPLPWKVTLLGLAQLGFEKMPAFKASEQDLLQALTDRYLTNRDTDPLTPADQADLATRILNPRRITVDPNARAANDPVQRNVDAAPNPRNVYEGIADRLDGDPAARGGVYGTLVQMVDTNLRAEFDQMDQAQRDDRAEHPDEPRPGGDARPPAGGPEANDGRTS